MLVYIHTQEPYHDNSSILGVYLTLDVPMKLLEVERDKRNADPQLNQDDEHITEWDTEKQDSLREWDLHSTGFRQGKSPQGWTFHQPVGWIVEAVEPCVPS